MNKGWAKVQHSCDEGGKNRKWLKKKLCEPSSGEEKKIEKYES